LRLERRRASPGVADAEGETPLMVAARLGHAGLVSALLDAGADPDAVDQLGWTALQKAMVRRHVEVVNIIVKVLERAQRFDALAR
jgi:ankyrin repeat protein